MADIQPADPRAMMIRALLGDTFNPGLSGGTNLSPEMFRLPPAPRPQIVPPVQVAAVPAEPWPKGGIFGGLGYKPINF